MLQSFENWKLCREKEPTKYPKERGIPTSDGGGLDEPYPPHLQGVELPLDYRVGGGEY